MQLKRSYLVASVLFAALMGLTAGHALAASTNRVLAVNGLGVVSIKPDMVTIVIGVETEAKLASDALGKNSITVGQVLAVLKQSGIEDEDIQTVNISVQPIYRSYKRRRDTRVLGHRVTNSLKVKVKGVARLGRILDAVVSVGSNRIGAIRFGATNHTRLLARARRLAVKNAIEKAKLYAGAAGVKLGPILSISEGGISIPRPIAVRSASYRGSVPISGGQIEIRATVAMRWAIE